VSNFPKQAIAAPPAVPPRYSLLSCAQEIDNDDRWELGVRWAPEQTLGGGVVGVDCTGETDPMSTNTQPAWSEADPFVVWAEDHCSTLGSLARDFVGRATRQLEATQSYRVAEELWSGALAQADSLDNVWLTENPEIVTSTPLDADDAASLIDHALGRMLGGRRGMIHVSIQMINELTQGRTLIQQGQQWVTTAGNLVVADAGYPGTDPDGHGDTTHQWIYATPMIAYRLGPIGIIPGSIEDLQIRAQATNKQTNLTTVYAERQVLLQWDSLTPIGTTGTTGVLAAQTSVAAFTAF